MARILPEGMRLLSFILMKIFPCLLSVAYEKKDRGKKMNLKRISIVLLAFLLLGLAMVPIVNANDAVNKEVAIKQVIPNISAEDFKWLSGKDIIATSGKVPSFKEADLQGTWTKTLRTSLKTSNVDLKDYLYPQGPVIGTGIDYLGGIEVYWNKDSDVDQKTVEKIIGIITDDGRNAGMQETPIIVIRSDMFKGDASRTAKYRPIIGGVQMAALVGGGTAFATLGFSARDSNGNNGYLITSHLPASIGQTIYQPASGQSAGTVTQLSGNYADAAFVQYSNVEGTIIDRLGSKVAVKYYSDANLNDQYIMMSGISSQSSGKVTVTDVMAYNVDLTRYLYDQHIASYTSMSGDSGAPVYWKNINHDIVLCGIHWGTGSDGSVYSPISAVRYDMGITPITR
ncbi:MAG: hypothetical protein WC379_14615 [Methanoregula sp.]|jgi:hypothetical protein